MSRRNSVRRIRNLLHAHRATDTAFASSPSMSANSSYFAIVRRVGKFVSSLLIAVFVAAVLMGAVYRILPKESFINLQSMPDALKISQFDGSYKIHANSFLTTDGGIMRNQSKITIKISDFYEDSDYETLSYELKEGELEIKFISENFNPSGIFLNGPYERFWGILLDKESIFSAYIPSFQNGNLSFLKKSSTVENNNDLNYLEVTVQKNSHFSESIIYSRGTEMTLEDRTTMTIGILAPEIFIKGEKINVPTISTIEFFKGKGESNIIMMLDSDLLLYRPVPFPFQVRTTYPFKITFDGSCVDFSERCVGESDTLKQTYLNVQKEYDIALLRIRGSANHVFDINGEFSEEKNYTHISGEAKEISMGGTSLNFNFITFLYENLSAVLFAVFGAMLSTYLPMLLPEEKRKKE